MEYSRPLLVNALDGNPISSEWSFKQEFGFETLKVVGWYMFVVLYKNKLSDNISIPDSVRELQKWTTNVGRVAALASGCFKGDKFKDWDVLPKIGDWIVFKVGAADIFKYRGIDVAIMYDDATKSIVSDPSYVTRD